MDYSSLVPQRLDIFAFIIFLGVAQGFFFSYFLLKRRNRLNPKNKYLGLFLLIHSAVLLEVFLCYSGLIVHTLWLVDYSESTNFLIGPIIYFLVLSFLGIERSSKRWLHYLPFCLYLLYMIFFFVQVTDYKFNAYIDAYYPDLPKLAVDEVVDPDPLYIKKYINPLCVTYTGVYVLMGLLQVFKQMRTEQLRFFQGADREMAWIRNLILLSLVGFLFWFFKSFTGLRDVQDHIGAAITTVIIYFVGFRMVQQGLMASGRQENKYSRSSLSEDRKAHILEKLDRLKLAEDYFLDGQLTMTGLAEKLKVSSHHLSQVLNEELGKSYGEYINELRIEHAQKLLIEASNLKIEEIAEQSGFNSKSTFNTAFKKLTGQTPSQYRSEQL